MIKTTKITLGVLLLMTMIFSISCNKYFEGVNENPNDPLDVTPDVLLSAAQANLAFAVGGDISRVTSVWMQQATGVARQWTTYQRYGVIASDFDNVWEFNMYAGPLLDLKVLEDKAMVNGYPEYEAVAKILIAYGMGITTDLWGDVPYSQAFLGAENMEPAYDSQQAIYTAMQLLLDDAVATIDDIGVGTDPGGLAPGADDLIYGGDMDMWRKTANVLKARFSLNTSEVDASAYAAVLTALGAEGTDSYGSSGEDCQYVFGTTETSANPWYQFNDQRGDIDASGWMHDSMLGNGDPRFDAFIDTSGGGAMMGPFYASINSPVPFISYVEQLFMEAEAAMGTSDAARAATAYNKAVIASLAQFNSSDATWEAANAAETAGSISMEKIITQKYFALYTQPQVWSDWRRKGFPAIMPATSNVTGDVIPTRFLYPLSEMNYNSNAPAGNSLTTTVWWDQ